MTATPKISIIMPTWNRAAFILDAVGSVISQTYQNWELIIVDDGSTDNTEAIIAAVKDSRIKFYKAGKIGIGIRLKTIGIEKANGELIAFLDSDDMWAPEKLEKQVAALQDHPGAGFSITGGYNFSEANVPLEYFYKERKGLSYGNIFLAFFRSEAAILPPTLMLRRQCLPILLQFARDAPFSDVEFMLELAAAFHAVILYEPLLYRRLHDHGYSTLNWEKGFREGVHVIHTYKHKGKLPAAAARDALFRLYVHSGEKYLAGKKKQRALHCFFKAWANKPFSIVPLKKTAKAILYQRRKQQ